ncbi:MAG: MarR family transcriptional regulator [Solirubrobacterales bacterium]|nr:MarR family transcriptional regulator [Solirubrobacterales bacterium]
MANSSSSATLDRKLSGCEVLAWRGMLRTHAAVTKQLDSEMLSAHGISLSSYEVLLHLDGADDGHLRMCDLAELAVLSRSGLTRLVDRLAREQLLVRESCPSDARGSFARLTDAGRERLAEARPEEQQALADCWAKVLPAAEVADAGECCGEAA